MKSLLLATLLSASLFAATSSSDRQRITELELKLALQDKTNTLSVELYEAIHKTDENQNDSIAQLLDQVTKLEKRIKILEKRIK